MTQTQARRVARILSGHLAFTVPACSEDTWMGRPSGTTHAVEWGVVVRGLGFVTDITGLPDDLRAVITEED